MEVESNGSDGIVGLVLETLTFVAIFPSFQALKFELGGVPVELRSLAKVGGLLDV